MENNFNYNITYYKVTNEKECHNGYQYHDGLNILQEEFNSDPKASCVPGGFYFTNYEHLPYYINWGVYIREVSIPRDAQVIKDITGDKWRADKIIFGKRYRIKEDFEKWFDPEKFNWVEYSHLLPKYFADEFEHWFKPKKFNWADSYHLAIYCSEHFDKWFDAEKFNWGFGSDDLAQFCSDKFDKWFDPEKFNWTDSYYLAIYCSEHFDKWFDPEKFNWEIGSGYLAEFCADIFDQWFDSEKFNWGSGSCWLAIHCSDKFEQWFDPEKYYFGFEEKYYLEKFCSKYKHIWGQYLTKWEEE